MGYRPWYLVLRTLHRVRSQPSAIGMLVGYAGSAVRRRPQLPDEAARAILRDDQRIARLGRRRQEALGRARVLHARVEESSEELSGPQPAGSHAVER